MRKCGRHRQVTINPRALSNTHVQTLVCRDGCTKTQSIFNRANIRGKKKKCLQKNTHTHKETQGKFYFHLSAKEVWFFFFLPLLASSGRPKSATRTVKQVSRMGRPFPLLPIDTTFDCAENKRVGQQNVQFDGAADIPFSTSSTVFYWSISTSCISYSDQRNRSGRDQTTWSTRDVRALPHCTVQSLPRPLDVPRVPLQSCLAVHGPQSVLDSAFFCTAREKKVDAEGKK